MPTTDSYGQGIDIAALTDAPDGPKAVRDLADGVIPRSILRFADAAERNATLTGATAPVAGMMAWLDAEEILTLYDGAAWVTVATATTSWTTLSLAAGYAHDGNSNGNAQYKRINVGGADMIVMRGGISITYSGGNLPNSGNLLSSVLPTTARPTTVRTLNVTCSNLSSSVSAFKMDAETSGQLELAQASGSTPPWISLNGVMYSL